VSSIFIFFIIDDIKLFNIEPMDVIKERLVMEKRDMFKELQAIAASDTVA